MAVGGVAFLCYSNCNISRTVSGKFFDVLHLRIINTAKSGKVVFFVFCTKEGYSPFYPDRCPSNLSILFASCNKSLRYPSHQFG